MDKDNDNIFTLVNGNKADAADETLPENEYCITTTSGSTYYATGFLVFTSQHVAIMKDIGKGAIPAMVVPLSIVEVAELVEDED